MKKFILTLGLLSHSMLVQAMDTPSATPDNELWIEAGDERPLSVLSLPSNSIIPPTPAGAAAGEAATPLPSAREESSALARFPHAGDFKKGAVPALAEENILEMLDISSKGNLATAAATQGKPLMDAVLEEIFSTHDQTFKIALHQAVLENNVLQVQRILKSALSAASLLKFITSRDNKGKNPLNYSAEKGFHEIVSLLLSACPDESIFDLLIALDESRANPLHLAAAHGYLRAIKTLLQALPDNAFRLFYLKKTKNRQGKTAQEIAENNNRPNAKRFLKQRKHADGALAEKDHVSDHK